MEWNKRRRRRGKTTVEEDTNNNDDKQRSTTATTTSRIPQLQQSTVAPHLSQLGSTKQHQLQHIEPAAEPTSQQLLVVVAPNSSAEYEQRIRVRSIVEHVECRGDEETEAEDPLAHRYRFHHVRLDLASGPLYSIVASYF